MEDTDLKFDTSVLENRGETYSSLTDIHDIPLFTTAFAEKVEEVQEQNQKKQRDLNLKIFVEDSQSGVGNDEVKAMLFYETTGKVIKKEQEGQIDSTIIPFLWIGIAGCLFAVLLCGYCNRKNKKIEEAKKSIEESFEDFK